MKAIREIRRRTGLSQTEFGKRLGGIPLRTVQHWESGEHLCPPYVVELIEYRVEHDQVFWRSDQNQINNSGKDVKT